MTKKIISQWITSYEGTVA
ncbi:hypothetical protein [Rummeliibacillus suwonensis]